MKPLRRTEEEEGNRGGWRAGEPGRGTRRFKFRFMFMFKYRPLPSPTQTLN
jgi:hypothetical protein